jgi:hypothetical protein
MNLAALKTYIKKYPVGASAGLLALVMASALVFRHFDFAETQSAFDVSAAEGQKLEANIAYAGQLEEQLKALEEANKMIAGRLVNPSDLAINLQYFYKLEAETGVKLVDTRPIDSRAPAKAAAKGQYTSVQYAVTLQGSYARTLTFLRRLENGASFCRIISGSCTQAQAEQGKGSGETSMSLTVELLGRS